MLEIMRSLQANLGSLKADNVKLINAKSEQEEINELILKGLKNHAPHKNNGKNSCINGKRRKENIKGYTSEESTDNIQLTSK